MPSPTLPAPSDFAAHWDIDPNTVYLNHGSFGATPRVVLEAQRAWRSRMESELVKWFVEEHSGAIDQSRKALGQFLNCDWDCIAPVPNATIAVATVFANANLSPGDEVLITDHEYPACQNNARWYAGKHGATVTVAKIPFPIRSADEVTNAILAAVTPRTKYALLSHVTSSSGLIFPLEHIVPALEAKGIRTLVDAAHAPGMVPGINLRTLGASYYTANCHKWICSPKSGAFLFVRRDLQSNFRPLALSNNAEQPKQGRSQFLTEFEYIGTQDMSAFYAISDAIRVMNGMVPAGWPEVMRRNHDLCLKGRDILCNALGMTPAAPDAMVGSICTMILPPHPKDLQARLSQRPTKYHDALWDTLLAKWKIQVPIWTVANTGHRTLRISAQLYNSVEQYEYLAKAIKTELEAEKSL
ncbi:MAG: aminotransferase class V-fold PLP-dependent enzyme [Phycisphaerales bacterium]